MSNYKEELEKFEGKLVDCVVQRMCENRKISGKCLSIGRNGSLILKIQNTFHHKNDYYHVGEIIMIPYSTIVEMKYHPEDTKE